MQDLEYEKIILDSASVEKQIFALSQLACVGEFSSSMVREICSPLTVVKTCAKKLEKIASRSVAESRDVMEMIQTIGRRSDDIVQIVEVIKSMAHCLQEQRYHLPVNEVFEQLLMVYSWKMRSNGIGIEITPCESVLTPNIDANKCLQILVLLVKNAMDGLIEQPGDRWIKVDARQLQEKVAISVSDSGPKIPKDWSEKIWDPVFGMNEMRRGAGLSLALCRKALGMVGGEVELDQDSEWTRFVVKIPIDRLAARSSMRRKE